MKKINAKNILRLAQSTSEYAVLLAVVAAALIAMQIYTKRALQGRIKELADQISQQHYEKGRVRAAFSTVQEGKTVQEYEKGVTRIFQGKDNVEWELKAGIDEKGGRPEFIVRGGNETIEAEVRKVK